MEGIKESCRDARGTRWAHDLAQDLRFSARRLVKERRVTLVAMLALALGIGVNNAQFTVVDAICLRGLPLPGAHRLVDISNQDDAHRAMPLSQREFDALRTSPPAALESVGAFASRPAVLRDDERAAERITVAYVAIGALATAGLQPMLGRDFRSDEGSRGNAAVAILAARLWHSRYDSDPAIVGRVVRINGAQVPVVGVMPDGVRFPDNADLWQPLAALDAPPDTRQLSVYGRLADPATIADAQSAVAALLTRPSGADDKNGAVRPIVTPLNDRYNGDITNPAWIAFMTVGILLVVIACSNVATLLLASGAARAREMAIRVSLGATRMRIVRQLLVESLLLACAGGPRGHRGLAGRPAPAGGGDSQRRPALLGHADDGWTGRGGPGPGLSWHRVPVRARACAATRADPPERGHQGHDASRQPGSRIRAVDVVLPHGATRADHDDRVQARFDGRDLSRQRGARARHRRPAVADVRADAARRDVPGPGPARNFLSGPAGRV
jgi:hypothetical protein